jgi:phosphoribosylanthranilate isomerase
MRSIPIAQSGMADRVPTLDIARKFETISDYFLTDTLVVSDVAELEAVQPVNGFVGITGKTCDWDMAAKLVKSSTVPVILAGGISPDNVLDGIESVKPAGVDSCTLTNAVNSVGQTIRFRKDLKMVTRLVDSAASVRFEA